MVNVEVYTTNGHLFTCDKCNKFHFEFNQIGIDFATLDTVKEFQSYLNQVNNGNFEEINKDSQYKRKIHIPFYKTSIKLLLNKNDLKELIYLIDAFLKYFQQKTDDQKLMRQLSNFKTVQYN